MLSSKTVSISIRSAPSVVYDFVRDARNLPRWAAGLCKSVRPEDDGWIVDTPVGEARLHFSEANPYGILDHVVTPAAGTSVQVPMRVVPNGSGSELLFTVFRLPGMSEDDYAADIAAVEHDLAVLKNILES